MPAHDESPLDDREDGRDESASERADLTDPQRSLYLFLVVLSALSAVVARAPVSLHRVLFQRMAEREVLAHGHAALVTALATVAVLLVGVVAFVFDVVLDIGASLIASMSLAVLILVLWLIAPAVLRARREQRTQVEHS